MVVVKSQDTRIVSPAVSAAAQARDGVLRGPKVELSSVFFAFSRSSTYNDTISDQAPTISLADPR